MSGASPLIRQAGAARTRWGIVVSLVGLIGCITKDDARKLVESIDASQPAHPDVLPVLLSRNPVRYPAALYGRKAQGNVTLRIFIDSTGRVRPESTRVEESSSEPVFDSAAVAGARDLRFSPAMRKGAPMAVSVLFPVYFRVPQEPPLPGDTILHRGQSSLSPSPSTSPSNASPGGRRGDSARR